jgi:hypothetical protein
MGISCDGFGLAGESIALKSFARYLARKQIWYAGTKEQRTSVLEDVQQPKPSPTGMPGYSDDELRGMLRAVESRLEPATQQAVIAVELHGFRSKESSADAQTQRRDG